MGMSWQQSCASPQRTNDQSHATSMLSTTFFRRIARHADRETRLSMMLTCRIIFDLIAPVAYSVFVLEQPHHFRDFLAIVRDAVFVYKARRELSYAKRIEFRMDGPDITRPHSMTSSRASSRSRQSWTSMAGTRSTSPTAPLPLRTFLQLYESIYRERSYTGLNSRDDESPNSDAISPASSGGSEMDEDSWSEATASTIQERGASDVQLAITYLRLAVRSLMRHRTNRWNDPLSCKNDMSAPTQDNADFLETNIANIFEKIRHIVLEPLDYPAAQTLPIGHAYRPFPNASHLEVRFVMCESLSYTWPLVLHEASVWLGRLTRLSLVIQNHSVFQDAFGWQISRLPVCPTLRFVDIYITGQDYLPMLNDEYWTAGDPLEGKHWLEIFAESLIASSLNQYLEKPRPFLQDDPKLALDTQMGMLPPVSLFTFHVKKRSSFLWNPEATLTSLQWQLDVFGRQMTDIRFVYAAE